MTPEENRRNIKQQTKRSLPITISMTLLGLAGFGGALYVLMAVDSLSLAVVMMVGFFILVGIFGTASAIEGKYINWRHLLDIFVASP